MSNHLAIAAVTSALKRHLQRALDDDLPGAIATALSPQTGSGLPTDKGGVNIYLYRVTPNLSRRNADLPTRTPSGALAARPVVTLDLHYLLSFYGEESSLTPQIALASVVRRLHVESALPRATLAAVETGALATSSVRDDHDLVRFTPTSLTLEEMSKLWSVMLQTTYTLSVAYVATFVTIEADVQTREALPVRSFGAIAVPFVEPVIEAVLGHAPTDPSSTAVADPILHGHELVLVGRALVGDRTHVRLDGVEHTPNTAAAERVTLKPPMLRAGTHVVQVVHALDIQKPATPPEYRLAAESRAVPFVLRPRATFAASAPGQVTVKAIEPPVGPLQRAVLLLNAVGVDRAYVVPAPNDTADRTTITFALPGVAPGPYLARLRVDGADTVLTVDPVTKAYDGPKVTL